MDVEFEFKEKNGGACVTKLLAPGAVCVVPESLGGASGDRAGRQGIFGEHGGESLSTADTHPDRKI